MCRFSRRTVGPRTNSNAVAFLMLFPMRLLAGHFHAVNATHQLCRYSERS